MRFRMMGRWAAVLLAAQMTTACDTVCREFAPERPLLTVAPELAAPAPRAVPLRAAVTGMARPAPQSQPQPVQAVPTEERLRIGQEVQIRVEEDARLSVRTVIAEDGAIGLPLLGPMPAAGLRPRELAGRVAAAYEAAGYVKAPHVRVYSVDVGFRSDGRGCAACEAAGRAGQFRL